MKIYYLNSTHWDREWYLAFQGFRYNLVDMVNDLIEIMENDPEYKLFCFDGQTIVLEDYAEIEPEGAKKLKRLIEDGRILVGPWYVMPDEFLVSGESLIRNLMTGDALAKKWGGKPWKYGYVNDIFGHIAQMPQIFAGFDINGSYLGRGLGNTEFNHFVWQSPDGTKCYTSIGCYGAFARTKMNKYGTEEFPELLKNWIDFNIARSDAPIVFFSNTDDHKKATAYTPKVLNMIREMYPEAEVVDADLSVMAKELKKYESCLPIVCGELNKPIDDADIEYNNMKLLYNCLSSYYPIKQENDYCQNLLEKQTEPMLAVSAIEGKPIKHRYVDVAYRYLLENHPHDSICGCSADQVHKDMIYRFDQVRGICNRLYDRFLEFDPHGKGDEYELKVYNFTPTPHKRFITANIDFFKNYPAVKMGYAAKEAHNNFKLFDEKGKEIPYQIIKIDRNVKKRIVSVFQSEAVFDVYSISFYANMPAFGYSVYKVTPEAEKVAYANYLPYGESWAENDLIRLDIRPNGQLDITDKRTGRIYSKLNELTDNAEVGDGWRHESPINGYTTGGFGSNATVSLVSAGFAIVEFKIEKDIMLPAFLDPLSLKRSEIKKPLHIEYSVTLRRDSAAVEVEMKIENNIKDHRLRLMFPTEVEGKKYFAGQSFYCVERTVGVDAKTINWIEPECAEKNMNGIIGKRDRSGSGLAFVSPEGLHEGACHDDKYNTIAVTLFRCFDRVFLQTKAIRSQLQQVMTFKYAIIPLDSNTDYNDLLYIQHCLAGTDISYSRRVDDKTAKPESKSYLSLDNKNVQLSILKCAQDGNGYIARIFNVSDKNSVVNLYLNFDFNKALETNMNEETVKEIDANKNILNLSLKPWEIKTVRIV